MPLKRFGSSLRRIGHERRGSVAIQIALSLTLVIGFVSLGMEIAFLLMKHRQMQSAADGAALGAAVAIESGHPADFVAESRAIAAEAQFVHGVAGVSVVVNHPPTLGTNAGNASAVEVIISQPQDLAMVRLYRSGTFNVGARAVALIGSPGGLYCMLALDPSASSAAYFKNNAVATNPECGIAVNSSSNTALYLENNSIINGPVSVHGHWLLSNGSHIYGPATQNAPVSIDPYASVSLQTIPACTGQNGTVNSAVRTLNPGHFCSGFSFTNNATVTLTPGAYYVDTKLTMNNNVTVNATGGVTIIVNGNYAVNIGNNAALNVTAPTTGPYAGIALMGLRTATPTVSQVFGNNAMLNIVGALYFPNQILHFSNNGIVGTSHCTQVIARIIDIDNNVYLDNDCAATGVTPIGGSETTLVE